MTEVTCASRGISGRAPDDAEISRVFEQLIQHQARGDCTDLVQFRSLVTANQYRRLYHLLGRFVPAGSRVLDWGCGNGHFSYGLTRLGYDVSGFSFEDFCLRRYIGEEYSFTQGDPENPVSLPYEDAQFDAVTSVGVLEHVRETGGDERASLREIARTLRPGGYFICYHLPNRFSVIEAISRRVPGKHSHPYRYSTSSIRRLCRESGLSLLAVTRYGVLPRNVWHRSPGRLRHSPLATRLWNALDEAMRYPFSPICQNYLFVARKAVSA